MKNQKKGSKSFWKKFGLVVTGLGLVAVGAVAENKFGVVEKTTGAAVKGFNALKTGFEKITAKKPEVSNIADAPVRNNYQGTNYSQRKYNN